VELAAMVYCLSTDISFDVACFILKQSIAHLDQGKAVIPVWLDVIYQQLVLKLTY
jgi:hypothetical protein